MPFTLTAMTPENAAVSNVAEVAGMENGIMRCGWYLLQCAPHTRPKTGTS
jgi:hypothetical protein